MFVGSFNFDPRSARLNTELGFVIESEAMAQAVAQAFDLGVPDHAYRLELSGNGGIVWIENTPEGSKRWTTEPASPLWRRLYVKFLSWLPIEPLL